jgi:hypothetical protein
MFYNSLSPAEQQHMVEAAQFELGHVRPLSCSSSYRVVDCELTPVAPPSRSATIVVCKRGRSLASTTSITSSLSRSPKASASPSTLPSTLTTARRRTGNSRSACSYVGFPAFLVAVHGQPIPLSWLAQDSNNTFTAVGRKVAIFVLDGFDSTQVTPLVAGLGALGCVVQLIGARKGPA